MCWKFNIPTYHVTYILFATKIQNKYEQHQKSNRMLMFICDATWMFFSQNWMKAKRKCKICSWKNLYKTVTYMINLKQKCINKLEWNYHFVTYNCDCYCVSDRLVFVRKGRNLEIKCKVEDEEKKKTQSFNSVFWWQYTSHISNDARC